MKIIDIIKNKKTTSFEFFPPKKEEGEQVLFETIESLKCRKPDYTSVTYGAGGSSRDKTIEWVRSIYKDYGLEVMMHLTCVMADKAGIKEIVDQVRGLGVQNILALRGDVPEGETLDSITSDFKYAVDLVRYLREWDDLCIGVAGYPECHLEAKNMDDDLVNLKAKIDAGGDFVITQLFFDNSFFYEYVDKLKAMGVDVPVIAGIMPITNISQAIRFTDMCGVHIPEVVIKMMDGKSKEDMYKIGIEYAVKQCEDLKANGVDGLHFYTLNKSKATEEILEALG